MPIQNKGGEFRVRVGREEVTGYEDAEGKLIFVIGDQELMDKLLSKIDDLYLKPKQGEIDAQN